MDEQEKTVKMMVNSSMSFDDPREPVKAKVLEHFLYLVGTDCDLSDVQIHIAIDRLRQMLEESPSGSPRLLFGVELVSLLCDERRLTVTTGVEQVLKQYARVLTDMVSKSVGYATAFSSREYELVLDITQVIVLRTSYDSAGTNNTLIREIVRRAPEKVLKAKLDQLESPDFREDDPKDRARFYDVFVIAYLKRIYGMKEVMKQLRERKGLVNTVRIDTSGRRFCEMDEAELWKILEDNCEITDPTQDQHLHRQLMTAELVRRHPEDNVVRSWYEEKFPQLVRT